MMESEVTGNCHASFEERDGRNTRVERPEGALCPYSI